MARGRSAAIPAPARLTAVKEGPSFIGTARLHPPHGRVQAVPREFTLPRHMVYIASPSLHTLHALPGMTALPFGMPLARPERPLARTAIADHSRAA